MPGALGIVGDIMGGITKGQQVGQLQSAEKKYANLTPQQLSGMVTSAEQPLNEGLLQNVGNLVQAQLGQAGLSQSPGTFAAEETQAIAPYQQQQEQTALQLVLQKIGIPIEYANAIMGTLNSGSGSGSGGSSMNNMILAMLAGGGGGGGIPPGLIMS